MPKKAKADKKRRTRISIRVPRSYRLLNPKPISDRPPQEPNFKRSQANTNRSSGLAIEEVKIFNPTEVNLVDAKRLLEEDDDFIYSKRFCFSRKKLLERYAEGASDRVVAGCLMMTEEEFSEFWSKIVIKLRFFMGVTVD